jgi:hypothetical protein
MANNERNKTTLVKLDLSADDIRFLSRVATDYQLSGCIARRGISSIVSFLVHDNIERLRKMYLQAV